jgi:hypothetical protein
MAIYDHYTVLRSRIVHQCLVTANAVVSLYVDDDTSVAADPGVASEQTTGTSSIISALAVTPTTFKREWDAKAYFGGDIFDNDALQGDASNNPVEQSYFVLSVTALSGAVPTTLNFQTVIEYDVVFDELKTIASS